MMKRFVLIYIVVIVSLFTASAKTPETQEWKFTYFYNTFLGENEVVPNSLDEWMATLDSLTTSQEKQLLRKLKDQDWPFGKALNLNSDFLARSCIYYDGHSYDLPFFLKGRDLTEPDEIYEFIISAYIKYLNGQPYKGYYDYPEPKNINDFFSILQSWNKPIVKALKKTSDENKVMGVLYNVYEEYDFEDNFEFEDALFDKDEKLTLLGQSIMDLDSTKNIANDYLTKVLAIATYRHFNNKEVDLQGLVSKYAPIKILPMWMCTEKDSVASINGVYVPVDVVDACRELDKMLDDNTKAEIVKLGKDFLSSAHTSLGMWIRNNWGLWGGSRLQAYLRNKGCSDPDSMSKYILERYQFWLETKADEAGSPGTGE